MSLPLIHEVIHKFRLGIPQIGTALGRIVDGPLGSTVTPSKPPRIDQRGLDPLAALAHRWFSAAAIPRKVAPPWRVRWISPSTACSAWSGSTCFPSVHSR
jgi:hypothetical protein